jgi:hypothetical protein
MTKHCSYCEKEFIVTKEEKYYCSMKCRKIRAKYQKNYNKKYYKEHEEERKIYLQKNKQKIRLQIKKYQEEHKEEIGEYHKKYNKNNHIKRNLYINKYLQNPINKLIALYRSRICSALKNKYKLFNTFELLGCSVKQLKNHLEKQFTSGMSWDNHSKFGWHVDHIIPCCSFDLSKKSEQLKCFNYTNLRPLWAEENLRRPKQ